MAKAFPNNKLNGLAPARTWFRQFARAGTGGQASDALERSQSGLQDRKGFEPKPKAALV